MGAAAKIDLTIDDNLPPAVRPILAHGQHERSAEAKIRQMEEKGRTDAKAAILAENLRFGLVELGRLCPVIKPLLGHASIADNDDHTRTGPDFMGVDIKLAIPGFADIQVWVSRKEQKVANPDQPARMEHGPWEIGEFRVQLASGSQPHTKLPYALAVAREEYLRTAPDADVPF